MLALVLVYAASVRVLAAVGLGVLFVLGACLGLALGIVLFVVSLVRGARAVHAEGVLCRAEVIARDGALPRRFAGPALVRLSGALAAQATTGRDILGIAVRLQETASTDPRVGDQDLLFGTFDSFLGASRALAATDTGDYLANRYSTVTPWWVPGEGPLVLALAPGAARPRDRGADRLARLDADLADGTAQLALVVAGAPVAELRLVARLPDDGRTLRASMFRQGRGIRPVGLRNGIRATVYPMSQLARRLRGG